MIKNCTQCQKQYETTIDGDRGKQQKYCSVQCKDKAQYSRNKNTGNIRSKKSGYPRKLTVKLYMLARNSDITAPCHYCQTRLTPETFQLDHKIAMSKGGFTTKAEIQAESNLVVCCDSCNREKGHTHSYEQFKEMKNG
jgi:5-methylcytosine-specific restriction endonuclease McrA